MLFVSLRTDFIHEINIRYLLVTISLKLAYEFSNINNRKFRRSTTSHSFYYFFESVRNDFSITFGVTLLKNCQEHIFFSFFVNLIVE